jgi:hypothetical protein
MAALFVAGTSCPLASLIIITEVAQGYHLLPGLMWVVAIGYLLRPKPGLFRAQVARSSDSPAHRVEIESAFLSSRHVGQLCRRQVPNGKKISSARRKAGLKEDLDLSAALAVLRHAKAEELPVVDATGKVVGVFGYSDMVSR